MWAEGIIPFFFFLVAVYLHISIFSDAQLSSPPPVTVLVMGLKVCVCLDAEVLLRGQNRYEKTDPTFEMTYGHTQTCKLKSSENGYKVGDKLCWGSGGLLPWKTFFSSGFNMKTYMSFTSMKIHRKLCYRRRTTKSREHSAGPI